MKMFDQVKLQRQIQERTKLHNQLLRHEAVIGGQLFGPIPANTNRYFFRMGGNIWIWHEEITDPKTGQKRIITSRYEIRPNGVLKSQNGQSYKYIDKDEIRNLYQTIKMYYQRVSAEVYGRVVTV